MGALNEDILRHILEFVPVETLDKINSSNYVFYEAWMKSRYAMITLIKRDKEVKRLLAHLCNPYVARHVQKVNIRPWLVQPRTKSPRSLTENVIIRFMELVDPDYTRKTAERRLQKRLRKDTAMVTAAFAQMKNVNEYNIDWDDNDGFHPEFYHAFLAPPLEKWAGHLVKLTIKVPPSMVDSLASVRLPHLEDFTYHLSTDSLSLKDINNSHDGFVVFVNNLRDSLVSLTFSSTYTSQNLDLSRIFRMMGTFPSLRKVSLSIPFDGGHLSEPMSFVGFLLKHRGSLKEFGLLTSRCTVHSKPGDPEHINWIQKLLASFDQPFPLLRGLKIALRPLRAPLDILVVFLDKHSSTLQSVTFMDRSLAITELEGLFGSSPYRTESIQELHVKVDALSATFLARIARLFPNLKILKLECARIDIDRTCVMNISLRNRGVTEFFGNLHANRQAIRGWGLQHLAIGPSEYNWVRVIEHDLVHYLPKLTVSCFTL
ncbi:hypothetical protein BDZ97DRAFT_1757265 [Flammula alnicola]|nr:hypothetical protein BDZ97DRAFT_1757265 [Flammula alnicola]